jgi:flagellar export protein FliJ
MLHSNNFRLQSVLDYKSNMVDTLELEFAQLKLTHKDQMEIMTQLEMAYSQEMDSLQGQQHGTLDCQSIVLRQQFLQMLERQVNLQRERVKRAESRVNAKRDELVEMIKGQKTLEKLQANHVENEKIETRRRESRMIDDIVTTRYARER